MNAIHLPASGESLCSSAGRASGGSVLSLKCSLCYSGSQIDVRLPPAKHPNTKVPVAIAETVEGMLSPQSDRVLHLFEKRYSNAPC